MRALFSLLSSILSLPQKITPELRFSKPYFKYSLFFQPYMKICMFFLLNVEHDEFGLRRRNASPFANPVFTPLSVSHEK